MPFKPFKRRTSKPFRGLSNNNIRRACASFYTKSKYKKRSMIPRKRVTMNNDNNNNSSSLTLATDATDVVVPRVVIPEYTTSSTYSDMVYQTPFTDDNNTNTPIQQQDALLNNQDMYLEPQVSTPKNDHFNLIPQDMAYHTIHHTFNISRLSTGIEPVWTSDSYCNPAVSHLSMCMNSDCNLGDYPSLYFTSFDTPLYSPNFPFSKSVAAATSGDPSIMIPSFSESAYLNVSESVTSSNANIYSQEEEMTLDALSITNMLSNTVTKPPPPQFISSASKETNSSFDSINDQVTNMENTFKHLSLKKRVAFNEQ